MPPYPVFTSVLSTHCCLCGVSCVGAWFHASIQALGADDRVTQVDQLVQELNTRSQRLGMPTSQHSYGAGNGVGGGGDEDTGATLLVLDNAEDLVQAGSEELARLVTPLLEGCPHCSFLVTSKVGTLAF